MGGTIVRVVRLWPSLPSPGVTVARQMGWHGAGPGVPAKGLPFHRAVLGPLSLPNCRAAYNWGE